MLNGRTWTLEQLNGLDQLDFIAAAGGVFEHSPWIACETWRTRPFLSVEELHRAMAQVVEGAREEAQLALLRAHPDLGARIAMTDHSKKEQSGAGLDRLTRREYRYMSALNRLYREKHGFPFIMAVKGRSKDEIIGAMRRRIRNVRAVELKQALREVEEIARLRLDDLIVREKPAEPLIEPQVEKKGADGS